MTPLELIRAVEAQFKKLANQHYYLTVAVLFLWVLLTSGAGTIPREPYRLTALNPFQQVTAYPQNYFQASPLLPLIGHYTGLVSGTTFAVLSLAIYLGALFLLAWWGRRRFGPVAGLFSAAFLLAHPVSTTSISWLGTPDTLTLMFTVIVLFARRPALLLIAGALGAFNHPAMYFIGPSLLLLRTVNGERDLRWAHWVAMMVGLALGSLGVILFLSINHIHTFSRMDFILARNLKTWLKSNLSLLPLSLFSLHQMIWLAVILALVSAFRSHRKLAVAFAGVQVLLLGVTFFNADTTRVFSILSWAPALYLVLNTLVVGKTEVHFRPSKGVNDQSLWLGGLVSITLGLLVPRYYVWVGELHPTSINEFYAGLWAWLRALR